MKRKFLFIMFLVFLLLFMTVLFVSAQEYSLMYGVCGISGGVCTTTNYQFVDLVNDLGVVQEIQTGGVYTILPVIGISEATSSVCDWMLY